MVSGPCGSYIVDNRRHEGIDVKSTTALSTMNLRLCFCPYFFPKNPNGLNPFLSYVSIRAIKSS